jgi:hypothetical protein
MSFRLFALCSVRVSALVTVRVEEWKVGALLDRWNVFSWSGLNVRCIERDGFQGHVGVHDSWEDNISGEEQG